ncbi:unnamed protein product [Didymodactylos carnosus]|uniref:MULE transposase domain-containing protein n=1 Tax=Didymodactylos carnosus TaxID=1234261 RepID=A0A814CJ74_9BILA|nr:unnamed protein product [Didymodactylos carnosus]CAF1112155.1 unnamed protein product [Didymodactylos carnosus]CAF3717453.1 unnamed protein product [Didymodactylos carnosus]CAF3880520.1 unnamed protein product [Didymodactylos carnosus]
MDGFPCVIGLLADRTHRTYVELFRELKDHATNLKMNFNPSRITSDFEKALIKAVASEFPQAHHSGCYFHFTQAIYRNIQTLGLTTAYRDDEDSRSACRKLMSLALIPLGDVKIAFEELQDDSPLTLRPLFNYFSRFWLNEAPIHLWNVCGTSRRTNNASEGISLVPSGLNLMVVYVGWHNRFNVRVNKHHPNIWHFINSLKDEETHLSHKYKSLALVGEKKKSV